MLTDAQQCSTINGAPNGVQPQSRQHRRLFGITWAGQFLEDCLQDVALQTYHHGVKFLSKDLVRKTSGGITYERGRKGRTGKQV